MKKDYYETLEEATIATRKLNIKSPAQYQLLYKQDPRLPASPQVKYSSEWVSWDYFFGNDYYDTIEEASEASIALGIDSYYKYHELRHLDSKLPPIPYATYKKDWKKFGKCKGFFKMPDVVRKPQKNVWGRYYDTVEEASQAALKLDIKSSGMYNKRYKQDPRLASSPSYMYGERWQENGGWETFLKDNEQKAA